MNRRHRLVRVLALTTLIGALPVTAAAQTMQSADMAGMSLEDLLKVDMVSIASKFPQEVREAPASITVVTAADIRRYGHRTLADVLRSVRGLYTTYDRNYLYAGVRGFSRPGDYNTRVLLLVDGYRLNEPLYDMAPIGTDFPLDVSLIDKVEVIRGPASSLYGTNAFFAVINVVTKTGAQHSGLRADTFGGSLGTGGGTVSYGRVLPGAGDLLVAGSVYRSHGAPSIRFPEYADDANEGLAVGLDDDDAANAFANLSKGHFSVRAGVATRLKQVPTAAFDTVFGDDRFKTRDTRTYFGGSFDGPLGRGWSGTARAAVDLYDYAGAYPYDYGDGVTESLDEIGDSRTVSGELTVRRHLARRHLFTGGVEMRRALSIQTSSNDIEGVALDERHSTTLGAVYVQDEYRPASWLIVNAGGRIDFSARSHAHVTPRVGLVFLPRPASSIKLLYGEAFRSPNLYERFYYDPTQRELGISLQPEQIRSAEAVWEEYISSRVRTTLTAYRYHAADLIQQGAFDQRDLYYHNGGHVDGEGIEGEIEVKLTHGVNLHYSQAYARVRDMIEEAWLSNSPRHLATFGVQAPLGGLQLGVEGQYVGERRTLGGDVLGGVLVPNVTLTAPAGHRVDFSLSVYNAFNASYGNPGGEEHRQRAIPQDGRTALARVRIHF